MIPSYSATTISIGMDTRKQTSLVRQAGLAKTMRSTHKRAVPSRKFTPCYTVQVKQRHPTVGLPAWQAL
eukprot:202804-Pleurochrysis_carterae.AAC.1